MNEEIQLPIYLELILLLEVRRFLLVLRDDCDIVISRTCERDLGRQKVEISSRLTSQLCLNLNLTMEKVLKRPLFIEFVGQKGCDVSSHISGRTKETTQFGSVSGWEIQHLPFAHCGIVSLY